MERHYVVILAVNDEERGERMKAVLQKATADLSWVYAVTLSPCGGGFELALDSARPASEVYETLTALLVYVLAEEKSY